MIFNNRHYLIINSSDLSLVNFDETLETSADTVRKSVDGTKTIIKWEGTTPDFVSSFTTTEGPYTHSEMLDLLRGPEWVAPDII